MPCAKAPCLPQGLHHLPRTLCHDMVLSCLHLVREDDVAQFLLILIPGPLLLAQERNPSPHVVEQGEDSEGAPRRASPRTM